MSKTNTSWARRFGRESSCGLDDFRPPSQGRDKRRFFLRGVADALKPQVVKQYSLDERTSAHDAIDAIELKHRCSND